MDNIQSAPNLPAMPAVKPPFKPPPILIVVSILAMLAILIPVSLIIYNKYSQKLVAYDLRCGNKECSFSQIKPGTEISLRIDASNAFAKYTNATPNLCYYSNIEPTQNLLKWELVTIEGKKFTGGCIKNAYNFYQKKSQFTIFVTGKIPNQKTVVKVFLTSSWKGTVGENVKNGGIEIFNLE